MWSLENVPTTLNRINNTLLAYIIPLSILKVTEKINSQVASLKACISPVQIQEHVHIFDDPLHNCENSSDCIITSTYNKIIRKL